MNHIKKISAIIMIGITVFSLAACSKSPDVSTSETTESTEELFIGTVISISDDGVMLVLPQEGSEAANSSDLFNILVESFSESNDIPTVGDTVKIIYSGGIEELYPAQLAGIISTEIVTNVDANDSVIRTFKENTDGTYECEGHVYKYILDISGTMPNSDNIVTYVYLSNIEEITFEQAWKASGLSSNTADYFEVKDAVLVQTIYIDS